MRAIHSARFIQAGGPPETLVRLLSDNYRGYAQMAKLMHDMLILAGRHLSLYP